MLPDLGTLPETAIQASLMSFDSVMMSNVSMANLNRDGKSSFLNEAFIDS